MINLKNYIIESILDIEDNIDNVDESIKDQIKMVNLKYYQKAI